MSLITSGQLEQMCQTDIQTVNADTLADIREISVDLDKEYKERLLDYVEQIKNPYCYRYGEYVVKISFTENGISLTDRLKEYIDRVATVYI